MSLDDFILTCFYVIDKMLSSIGSSHFFVHFSPLRINKDDSSLHFPHQARDRFEMGEQGMQICQWRLWLMLRSLNLVE
jgi:hypothetical protein